MYSPGLTVNPVFCHVPPPSLEKNRFLGPLGTPSPSVTTSTILVSSGAITTFHTGRKAPWLVKLVATDSQLSGPRAKEFMPACLIIMPLKLSAGVSTIDQASVLCEAASLLSGGKTRFMSAAIQRVIKTNG
jgi:hypothetical protein